jgi:hypothetical protein
MEGGVTKAMLFEKDRKLLIRENNIKNISDYLERINKLVPLKWIGPFLELRKESRDVITQDSAEINSLVMPVFNNLNQRLQRTVNEQYSFKYIAFDVLFEINKSFTFFENCFTYRDQQHLSKCGEKIIGKRINLLPVLM